MLVSLRTVWSVSLPTCIRSTACCTELPAVNNVMRLASFGPATILQPALARACCGWQRRQAESIFSTPRAFSPALAVLQPGSRSRRRAHPALNCSVGRDRRTRGTRAIMKRGSGEWRQGEVAALWPDYRRLRTAEFGENWGRAARPPSPHSVRESALAPLEAVRRAFSPPTLHAHACNRLCTHEKLTSGPPCLPD